MPRRFLRIYVLMCSLALMVGTTLGFWTGQGSAKTDLANDCLRQGIFVAYDADTGEHRHFHCFELPEPDEENKASRPGPPKLEV